MVYLYDTNTKYYIYALGSEDLVDLYKSTHKELQVSYTTVELTATDFLECYKFDETSNSWTLDQDLYDKSVIARLLSKIQKVADTLSKNAKYLLFPNVSPEQVDRYKLKYDKAKANDTAFFEYEANLTGISVTDLINLVIQNGQPIEEKYNELMSKIEGFRRGCKLLTFGKKYDAARRGTIFMKYLFENINLDQKQFLDYCAGNVTNIGDEDSTSTLSSVIDIIGYVPTETD